MSEHYVAPSHGNMKSHSSSRLVPTHIGKYRIRKYDGDRFYMTYKPTIGLEVHAELNTATKMFCDCPNDPHEEHPNENTCPICLGHPGTLPVANKKAIESIVKVGLALGGAIAAHSKFDRKNYFYPDLPKGYQISQYDQPFVSGGSINGVAIERVHLEEDAGSLMHPIEIPTESVDSFTPPSTDAAGEIRLRPNPKMRRFTLVDFNRAGCALMELVTKPVIKSAEEAVAFAKEYQLILKHLGVSEADMEHGQMRVEVNVSVSKDENFGTKVELKNLNSFRTVLDATAYEIKRQSELLDEGKKVTQETRGWDEKKQQTFSQRSKEQAHDYRYFPEPDLPPFVLAELFDIEKMKAELPELPAAKRARFTQEYGLVPEQAEFLVGDRALAKYFEEAASELAEEEGNTKSVSLLYNYLSSDLVGLMRSKEWELSELKIAPEDFADLISMVAKNEISSRAAKDILLKMAETGLDPRQIVKNENLGQVSDEGGLLVAVREILLENPLAVTDYKKGKGNALQFLIGKAMAKLKGRGNPAVLGELFKKELA